MRFHNWKHPASLQRHSLLLTLSASLLITNNLSLRDSCSFSSGLKTLIFYPQHHQHRWPMTEPLQTAINVSDRDPGWSSGLGVGVDLDTSEWYLMVRRRSAATKQGLIEVWFQEPPSFLGYVLRGNVDCMPASSCYFISAEAIEVMQGNKQPGYILAYICTSRFTHTRPFLQSFSLRKMLQK